MLICKVVMYLVTEVDGYKVSFGYRGLLEMAEI